MDLRTYDELVARGRKRPMATITAVVVLLVSLIVGAFLLAFSSERGRRAASDEVIQNAASNSNSVTGDSTSAGDAHTYQFVMQGRRFLGQSTNPFEEAQGYRARVEFCERHGIENLFVVISCYLTLIPKISLTISNSENPTTATYQDGNVAEICCMYVGESSAAPLYRITIPRGSMVRRTFQRGEVVHILLNIPDADPSRVLDAINFSPGGGTPAVLFPLRGNYIDHFLSEQFINNHRGDPEVERLIQDTARLRGQLRARAASRRGLTYPE